MTGKRCAGSYRYGFNGMEGDDEVNGPGRNYTTKFRQYDPRVGRWWGVDPKLEIFPWQSPYNSMDDNPMAKTDKKGDCVNCPTMLAGGLIGTGVGLYDLTQQHGGFFNAIQKLSEGDGKAWLHLATTTGTGVALGSGLGLFGSIGIATGSNLLDQTIQKDIILYGDFSKVNPVETIAAGPFAGFGFGGGKIVDKLLKPITTKGTALSPFVEKTVFPRNNPISVVGAKLGLGAASAVGEKLTIYLSNNPSGNDSADPSSSKELPIPFAPVHEEYTPKPKKSNFLDLN
tara:strand:+ start:601 stop:1458 length:858 start_codon:yes stop_codon:yes gene_type:complete